MSRSYAHFARIGKAGPCGTRLWIDDGRLADLREGERVLATYSTKDGKKIVSELELRTPGDAGETTNLGGRTTPFDAKSIEASD